MTRGSLFVLLALAITTVAACKSRSPAEARRDAAIAVGPADAFVCPGEAEDCAACTAGEGLACSRVANKVTPDRAKIDWYKRGCDLGDSLTCGELAVAYVSIISDPKLSEAADKRRKELEIRDHVAAAKRCAEHDDDACITAAVNLSTGKGVAKDMAAANALLEETCKRHVMRACLILARLDTTPEQRVKNVKLACASGYERSCGDLLGLYDRDPIAPDEFAFARDQLARLCSAENGHACWVLSGLYWLGKGTPKNRAKAGTYIERACALESVHCDVRDRWRKGGGFNAGADDKIDL